MMNNLYEPLVDSIEIGGREYRLDLSFDTVLAFFAMLEDDNVSKFDKMVTAFYNFVPDYPDKAQPEVMVETVAGIVEYLKSGDKQNGGEYEEDPEEEEEDTYEGDSQYYCLNEDAQYIYASFLQDYGIDLFEQHGKLHWSRFKALLNSLRDDTKFSEIVGIRAAELPSGKGEQVEEERKRLRKLKRIYALNKNQQQVDNELNGMFDYLANQGSDNQ